MKKSLLLVIAVLVFIASPAMAKEGFYLGAFIPNNTISMDAGPEPDSAMGWGLRGGVGFSRYVAIEADYSRTKHDITGGGSADLDGISANVKLSFPLTSLDSAQIMTVEPYLLLGYGHYELDAASNVKSDGLQWGFGIELYLFRELSINVGWTRSSTSWDTTPKVDGDIKTIDFGVIYHFI